MVSRSISKKPSYGIDAPAEVVRFFIISALYLVGGGSIALFLYKIGFHFTAKSLMVASSLGCITTCSIAFYMLYSSWVRKFFIRDALLNAISWQGSETVLDIGCNRGMLLIGAAKKLTTGKVFGVTINDEDFFSSTTCPITLANADLEDVTHKIALQTIECAQLPFADKTFDIVLSMNALHSLATPEERTQTIKEAIRVLKPGGQLQLFDILKTPEYLAALKTLPIDDLHISSTFYLWCVPGNIISCKKK